MTDEERALDIAIQKIVAFMHRTPPEYRGTVLASVITSICAAADNPMGQYHVLDRKVRESLPAAITEFQRAN